ncbi:MAG: ABC transporter permease [Candidatus Fimenecus sp.]
MTSQKSLKNNVRTKDFLRSLGTGWIYPAIALIVLFFILTYPVIKYVTSEQFVMSKVHNEISLFLTREASYVLDFTFLPIGMVLCGMITAIRMFSFMMRKNQTNVFFSMGISRMSLYFNRIAAGSLMLFLAVLIPLSITYFINIGYFGISTHLTQVYLYLVSLLFVSGLSGLAIGTMMSTVSGNVFEAGAGSIAFSAIGVLIVDIVNVFCELFLKGYVPHANGIKNNQWQKLFSPWTFGANLGGDKLQRTDYYFYDDVSSPRDLASLLESTGKDFKIPENLKVDMGFILPVLIWLGISVLLIALGAYLMKKRKAENAKSFGKFAFSRVVFAIFVFLVTTYGVYSIICDEFGFVQEIAILIGATLVVHFIIQLILTRNFKQTLKSLTTYAVLAVLTIITLTAVNTQVFGLYNKAPKAEEIKNVSIDVTGHPALWYNASNYDYESLVEGSDKKDIDTAIEIFEKLKKDSGKSDIIDVVHIIFEYKDGSKKVRMFPIYTDEVFAEYQKTIYNSSYFDKVLETMLLKEPVAVDTTENGMYDYAEGPMYRGYEGKLTTSGWHYVDSSVLLAAQAGEFPGEEIAADKEFYKCLYNDLSKMTYEELFKNGSRPLGVLTRYVNGYPMLTSDKIRNDDYYYYDGSVEQEPDIYGSTVQIDIPVYPQMTETLKYLNENGYEPEPAFDGEIKEILYTDSPISTSGAVYSFAEKNQNNYRGYGDWENRMYVVRTKIFSCDGSIALGSLSQTGMFINDDCSSYDMLLKVYNEAEHPLKKLDLAKSQQVLNSCVPFYSYYQDNGRFVYVIYENGIMMAYYLPQAHVGVLQ